MTVLVVDDEDDTRDILCEVLEQCGCSVLRAANAEEGLAALDRASPRVLVCDIAMPGGDGYWLVRELRTRAAAAGGAIPAVAITAHGETHGPDRTLAAGFAAHLRKPIDPWELCRVVATLCRRG